jgi:hypothetical protein
MGPNSMALMSLVDGINALRTKIKALEAKLHRWPTMTDASDSA